LLKPPDANQILCEQGPDALRAIIDNTPPEQLMTSVQPDTRDDAEPEIERDLTGSGPSPEDTSPTSTPNPPRRRQIVLCVGETERIVDEIETALIAARRGLYRRGGLIVSTGIDRMQTWDGKTVEIPIIEEIGDYALLEQIEAVMDFIKFDKEKMAKRVPPPMTLVRTLKERRHRLRLPNLTGVTNCPTIKADGELVTKPCFDPSTGMLFDPLGVRFPPVPESPSKAEAQASLARISRLLTTFPFVGVDDAAVALSLVLTAIARPGLPSVPMHDFDAPVAGAGKSKLVDLASILATGHEAGVIAQGENREEFEKRLSTLLMRGDPIIAIDNCELPVEGELLNSTLTQPRVTLRILGHSKGITVRSAALITATGNNLVIKGDLTRRTLNGRLDPKCERPELLQFDYDPIAEAKENRGEIVAAVLTILRAYHVAGRPKRPPRLQSFAEWSDTVRGALIWLGTGDPVKTMERLRKSDPVLRSLKIIMHAWKAAFDGRAVPAREAIEAANETLAFPAGNPTYVRSDLRDALMNVAGRRGVLDARSLGNWLAHHAADRVINLSDNGREEYAFETMGEFQGVALWAAVPR
jgi:putative DNA primase/helicase